MHGGSVGFDGRPWPEQAALSMDLYLLSTRRMDPCGVAWRCMAYEGLRGR